MNNISKLNVKTKIMGILVLVLVMIVTVGLVFTKTFSINNNSFYGVKLNDVTINNINITNIDIKEENGITTFQANIKALEEKNIKYVKIIFKDSDKKDIVSLIGYVGTRLNKEEKKKIDASTDADLSQVKSIEYEIIN